MGREAEELAFRSLYGGQMLPLARRAQLFPRAGAGLAVAPERVCLYAGVFPARAHPTDGGPRREVGDALERASALKRVGPVRKHAPDIKRLESLLFSPQFPLVSSLASARPFFPKHLREKNGAAQRRARQDLAGLLLRLIIDWRRQRPGHCAR